MLRWLRILWYRIFPFKMVEVEIADNALNRSSRFWWEARTCGFVTAKIMRVGPDGLYTVLLTKRWPDGSTVQETVNGVEVSTPIPDGSVQLDTVEGVNPERFVMKKAKSK